MECSCFPRARFSCAQYGYLENLAQKPPRERVEKFVGLVKKHKMTGVADDDTLDLVVNTACRQVNPSIVAVGDTVELFKKLNANGWNLEGVEVRAETGEGGGGGGGGGGV